MIAMIDNYDSFTYNLVQELREMEADLRVFRNDAITVDALDALARRIDWHLGETGAQGLSEIPFNGGTVDLALDVADDFSFSGRVRSDTPFTLRVFTPNGRAAHYEIAPGETIL